MQEYIRFIMVAVLVSLAFSGSGGAEAQAAYPPPVMEVSAEHPLFIFLDGNAGGASPEAYAAGVVAHWIRLPEALKPYSAMMLTFPFAVHAAVLAPIQAAGVPVVVRVAGDGLGGRYRLTDLEQMISAFTVVRGIEAAGFTFEEYDTAEADDDGVLPSTRWLMGAVKAAANYGRLSFLSLEGLAAPRMMANRNTAALYASLRMARDYVVPVAACRGPHTAPAASALMGLWLEGAVANWGVGADARWYADARFLEPNLCGLGGDPSRMPAGLYRAMILNGAMTGAAAYVFTWDRDLWFGATPAPWTGAILPTLQQIVEGGFVARRDLVQKQTSIALQLAPAASPREFEANLREIDPVYHQGMMMMGLYGMERPWQFPELILNRPGVYWAPLFSAHAPAGTLSGLTALQAPGALNSPGQWAELAGRYQTGPPAGVTAYEFQVGRGVFVMNSRENTIETQTFSLSDLPAPVRGFSARREEARITLTWPFREGDVAYSVWRRVPPETHFTLLEKGLDQRQFTDPAPPADQVVAYSVTALTGEKEPLSGTVAFGESFVFSAVESRIAEEVQVTPLLAYAESAALPGFGDETARIVPPLPALAGAATSIPWWPYYGGLNESQQQQAAAIVARIEEWDTAVSGASIDRLLDLYAEEYKDVQGGGLETVQNAWQLFFDQYRGVRMHRQIRRWDFANRDADGTVSILLYCQFTGAPIENATLNRTSQPIAFPRNGTGEVWLAWAERDGAWRMVGTRPALPNLRDILNLATETPGI